MKHLLFSILCLLFSTTLPAIGRYEPGDTLYVWAFSGLTLRAEPSLSAAKVTVIPYGTMLIVQNFSGDHSTKVQAVPEFKTDDEICPAVILCGDFAQVKFKGEVGYLFDGYLSKMPPFRYTVQAGSSQPEFEDEMLWATRSFGLKQEIPKRRNNSESGSPRSWIFSNGMSLDSQPDEKSSSHRYLLPDVSLEEAFLIFNVLSNYTWGIQHELSGGYSFYYKKESKDEWHFTAWSCSYIVRYLKTERVSIILRSCSC